MALVDYGSSGESGSESEDEGPVISINGITSEGPVKSTPPTSTSSSVNNPDRTKFQTLKDSGTKNTPSSSTKVSGIGLPQPRISENFLNPAKNDQESNFDISDDEDDLNGATFLDNSTDDGPVESDIFSLISKKLPAVKHKQSDLNSLMDKNEDTSDIVKKVDYGDKIELPPAKKKKKDGPVRISIPSLKDLQDAEGDQGESKPKLTASKKGSGLMALLPDPKNKMTRSRPIDVAKPETGEERIPGGSQNLLSSEPVRNNLKPTGVRKSGLVPHVLSGTSSSMFSRKPSAAPAVVSAPPMSAEDHEQEMESAKAGKMRNLLVGGISDSDDDDLDDSEVSSGSYFPGPSAGISVPGLPGSLRQAPNVAPEPEPGPVYGLKRPPVPPPIMPADPNFVSLESEADDLGPAVSVYPPPQSSSSEDHQDSLIDNEEAIARLAGKAAKRREFDEMKIIDINEDQMRGDPNVWLTKAISEEQAPMPNRKAGPKGLARSKHQITYLAHMAKEKDWELRQEWSQARANKRASMNKYGFC